MIRYMDNRPKGSAAIFKMEAVAVGFVLIVNVDTRRSHIEAQPIFNRAYSPIDWYK